MRGLFEKGEMTALRATYALASCEMQRWTAIKMEGHSTKRNIPAVSVGAGGRDVEGRPRRWPVLRAVLRVAPTAALNFGLVYRTEKCAHVRINLMQKQKS